MSLFENFTPFNFEEGNPTVSITKNGVTFNRAAVLKLNYPSHVILLINEDDKKIAIKVCNENDDNSASFYKKKDANIILVRWNSKDLLNTISTLMNWTLSENGYRIEGILIKEESAIIFDLNKAKRIN